MPASLIRSDHDSLAHIAQTFEREADQTRALLRSLKQCLDVLAGGDWIGKGATACYAEMNGSVLPAVQRLAAALETAGRTTKQMGQVMQAAEDEAADIFKLQPASIVISSASEGGTQPLGDTLAQLGSNFDGGQILYRGGRLMLDIAKRLPGNSNLKQLFETTWFKGGLLGTGILFWTLDDLDKRKYGDDLFKTIGVNTIKPLVEFAITRAHPVGFITLTANSAFQLAGDLQVGIQKTLAGFIVADPAIRQLLQSDANRVNVAVEQSNLGNVTRQFNEAVYETYANGLIGVWNVGNAYADGVGKLWQNPSYATLLQVSRTINAVSQQHSLDIAGLSSGPLLSPSGWRNLYEAGVAAVNVSDGLSDWRMATMISTANQGLGFISRVADFLPISSQAQYAVDETIKSWMQSVQYIGDNQINAFNLPKP